MKKRCLYWHSVSGVQNRPRIFGVYAVQLWRIGLRTELYASTMVNLNNIAKQKMFTD